MKKVLLSLVLILGCASTVLAQRHGGQGGGSGNGQVGGSIGLAGCRTDMIARNNSIIASFTGNNCQQALNQCEIDLQNRQRQGQNQQAYCQTVNNGNGGGQQPPQYPGDGGGQQPPQYPGDGGHNGGGNNGPRPGNPNNFCRADMISRNNSIIASFTGNNCQQASRQCQNDLQYRQSQGLNPYAICQTANNGGGNNGDGGYYPPPPPQPVNNDYGPAQTVSWQDFGSSKIDKVVIERVTLNVNNAYVNEILFRASNADIRIERVAITLSSGQVYYLPHQAGILKQNREVRLRLDQRYSLRVSRIEIEATSADLIGSRGRLQTLLGLAY